MSTETVNVRSVYQARNRITGYVRRTPMVLSKGLSQRLGANVYLKLECKQVTRSFKIRGAANALAQLTTEERLRGVVTVSTGNHGKAVATVAVRLGIPVTVCVPEQVLPHKVAAIRAIGADVAVRGRDQDEAEAHALELAETHGMAHISPFDDPAIIAGQGTIAIEILEDLPEIDTVIVPLSGGGLISGVAATLKQVDPGVRIVGASMQRGPVMYWSVQAGHPVRLPEEPTLADSLMGSIGLANHYTFDLVKEYVDDIALVSEREIAAAMAYLITAEHVVAEGGGAVGVAAALFDKTDVRGRNIVIVVSGGNVDTTVLRSILTDASVLDLLPAKQLSS